MSPPASPSPAARFGSVLLAGGVALGVALAFTPALQNAFVDLDDQANVVDNVRFRGLGPTALVWMGTTSHLGHWQPLSWLTLGVNYLLWGLDPAGYHLTSVLWHVTNAVLLYLTLLAYVAHPAGPRPAAVLLAALALLAKASAMAVPGLLLVLDVYPLRRLGGAAGWTSASARRVWGEKLPFVALAVASGVVALAAQRSAGALRPFAAVPAGARVGAAMYQVGFYLWKTVLPVRLLPMYEYPLGMGPAHPLALVGAATLTGVVAASVVWRRRLPGLGAAVAAYLVALGPTLGAAQSGPQVAADRYTYLAMLGWSVLAGAVAGRGALRVGGAVLVGLLAALTAVQAATWRDARTMWTRAVRIAPDNAFAQYRLADAERHAGDEESGLRRLREAVRLRPYFPEAQSDLGAVLAARGELDEALVHYQEAVRANPQYAFAYPSLGAALAAVGRTDQALALQLDLMEAHANLGSLLDQLGRTDEAMAEYTEALALRPSAEVLNNVAIVLARQGRPAEAAARYREALRLRPDLAAIQVNLAYALSATGDAPGARQALEAALRLEPGNAAARAGLTALGAPPP